MRMSSYACATGPHLVLVRQMVPQFWINLIQQAAKPRQHCSDAHLTIVLRQNPHAVTLHFQLYSVCKQSRLQKQQHCGTHEINIRGIGNMKESSSRGR